MKFLRGLYALAEQGKRAGVRASEHGLAFSVTLRSQKERYGLTYLWF